MPITVEQLLATLAVDSATATSVPEGFVLVQRDPQPNEIEACKRYLDRQIELIRPRIVVTLGRFSMARYFPGSKISAIHGKPRKLDGVLYYPMYHPAAALHQPKLRATVEQDMLKIPALIAELDQIQDTKPAEEIEQLSLF